MLRKFSPTLSFLPSAGRSSNPTSPFRRNLYPVIGDPVQLTQVIENVVINACEATPQRGKLLVRAENVDERAPCVVWASCRALRKNRD